MEDSKAQKWITEHGCKYNWWWGEVRSEPHHFTYYDINDGKYPKAKGESKACWERYDNKNKKR